ncbi:MAG: TetR/AcrR family transcriptional regulator [Lachnospiraceae bacterium]
MTKGIMLTPEQQMERRHEIKNAALQIFKDKGFQKTSMREISEVVGMGKSTLYDFFASKDEIIVFAYEEAMRTVIESAKEIVVSEPSLEQCLRIIMRNNLAYTEENKNLIGWLNTEASYLGETYQKRLHEVRYSYQDIIQSVVEKGIADGLIRKTDPALATRLLINSILSVAYTSRPSGTPEEMLEEAVNIFLYGVHNKPDTKQ